MLQSNIVGVTFGEAKANIQELKVGMVLDLAPYVFEKKGCAPDLFACKIMNGDAMCGHVAKQDGINQRVVESGVKQCRVVKVFRKDYMGFTDDKDVPVVGITFEVDIDVAKPIAEAGEEPTHQECTKVMSFNECIEINLYENPYGGWWYNGKRLHGVTREIDTMYKPFDKKIAGYCENKYNMKKEDILDMWSLKGTSANLLGKAVHTAMESYEKHNRSIYALPSHPILIRAVEGFPFTDEEVITEVLITDVKSGICGLIDRLKRNHDESLQIEDYKVNIEATVSDKKKHFNLLYPDLPYTKLTHYQAQMSYYTVLLSKTHKVSDTMIAWVYGEDEEWAPFELPLLTDVIERIEAHKKENS